MNNIMGPGPWNIFLLREDIKNLPIMEARNRYLQEQLLFENYISALNTISALNVLSAAAGAGGPLPSGSGGGDDPGRETRLLTTEGGDNIVAERGFSPTEEYFIIA